MRIRLQLLLDRYQIAAHDLVDRLAGAGLEEDVLALLERVAVASAGAPAVVPASATTTPATTSAKQLSPPEQNLSEECVTLPAARVAAGLANTEQSALTTARQRTVFSKQDVGKRVTIVGNDVTVDGQVRVVSWGNARHRNVADLTIVDVHERLKGLVTLEDKSTLQNPPPGLEQYAAGGDELRNRILSRGF